jgi:phosphoribosylaminoimidazolecarboxamide formyltransferase/IMP cyclohydrolase
MKKIALFSLHVLDKIDGFARALHELGWEIIASRETVEILSKNNIPVTDIADFTGIRENYGFPPTLHPKIESYLTGSQDTRINLVYVVPYPLSIGNDVGGRTLLALAAKGNRIPVMSVEDMQLVVADLKTNGNISHDLHQHLLEKTNALIACHYADLLKDKKMYDCICGALQSDLLNGENPYLIPAELFKIKSDDPLSLPKFKQISGDKPCFTNLADADSILQTMCLASGAFTLKYNKTPFICIAAKHGNACGMGISWENKIDAVHKALWGNPRSIWGGEVIVNFEIDEPAATSLYKSQQRKDSLGDAAWMLDIILAPVITPQAVKILGLRQERKLLENNALKEPLVSRSKYTYRFLRGGFLRQPPLNFILDFKEAALVGDDLNSAAIDSLIIAWSAAWSSSYGGNEIALVKDAQLLSVGGGSSTVEAALVAVTKAKHYGHDLSKASFAADAFFPFTDAPEVLYEAGIKTGLVPKGGKNFSLVEDFFKTKNVNMVYLAEKYRGFCRH